MVVTTFIGFLRSFWMNNLVVYNNNMLDTNQQFLTTKTYDYYLRKNRIKVNFIIYIFLKFCISFKICYEERNGF